MSRLPRDLRGAGCLALPHDGLPRDLHGASCLAFQHDELRCASHHSAADLAPQNRQKDHHRVHEKRLVAGIHEANWATHLKEEKASPSQWRPCALRHGIENSMEAILACSPALSAELLAGWSLRVNHDIFGQPHTAHRTAINALKSPSMMPGCTLCLRFLTKDAHFPFS